MYFEVYLLMCVFLFFESVSEDVFVALSDFVCEQAKMFSEYLSDELSVIFLFHSKGVILFYFLYYCTYKLYRRSGARLI